MRMLIWIAMVLPFSAMMALEQPAFRDLELEVTGIDLTRSGELVVMVFGESGFPIDHTQSVWKVKIPVTAGIQRFQIKVMTDKSYAIKVLHDENGNGRVDKKYGFIPAEGLGFSNKAKINMRAPNFEEARILPDDRRIIEKIVMQYL